MKRLFPLAVLFIFLITGCMTGMPGHINVKQSMFDDATETSMDGAWICKSSFDCPFKMALYKRSTMGEDQVIIEAIVRGTHSLSRGSSLHFNVDGEIISFKSIDTLTDFDTTEGVYMPGQVYPTKTGGYVYTGSFSIPPTNWSSKRYLTDKAFLKKIIKAEKVIIKVDLGKTYVEGPFSKDVQTTARPAFRNFYNQIFAGDSPLPTP